VGEVAFQRKLRTLGEVCRIMAGYGFPERLQGQSSGDLPFFKVGDISEAWKRGDPLLSAANHYISGEQANQIRAKPLPANTTVFAKIGAAIALNRRALLAQPSLVDNNVMGLLPASPELDYKYLYYFVCTLKLNELSRATTVPSVRKSDIEQIAIPVPSIAEQHQIVAEIEKQFTRLDAGVAALRRVQANLKRYRAAVLKAACEGRLVPTEAELAKAEGRSYETGEQLLARILADRRKNWHGRGKYKEPAAPDTADPPPLPEGWALASIDALAKLENGDRSKNYPSRTAFVSEGIPFINAGHLVRGCVLLDEMNYISEEHYGLLRAGKTVRGDILFCLRGSLGKVAVVGVDRAAIASSLVIVRPCQGVNTSYLQCYLSSWWTQQMIAKYDNGSAQPNLAAGDLARFAVPLPPFTEQVRIVADVDRRLSVIEELEGAVSANLQRATRLRRSILQRAFTTQPRESTQGRVQ